MKEKAMKNKSGIHKVQSLYQKEYSRHGIDPKSLFWPKGRQATRFQEHLNTLQNQCMKNVNNAVIIDYGCGFSDLYKFGVSNQYPNFQYIGVDIVDEFLQVGKFKYPENRYYLRDEFLRKNEIIGDILIASGTFNIMYEETYKKNYEFFLREIELLSSRIRKCLSIDFMTDEVDYVQSNAFHINPLQLRKDVEKKITARSVEIIKSKINFEYRIEIWI